jgi:hypothetical protein
MYCFQIDGAALIVYTVVVSIDHFASSLFGVASAFGARKF